MHCSLMEQWMLNRLVACQRFSRPNESNHNLLYSTPVSCFRCMVTQSLSFIWIEPSNLSVWEQTHTGLCKYLPDCLIFGAITVSGANRREAHYLCHSINRDYLRQISCSWAPLAQIHPTWFLLHLRPLSAGHKNYYHCIFPGCIN